MVLSHMEELQLNQDDDLYGLLSIAVSFHSLNDVLLDWSESGKDVSHLNTDQPPLRNVLHPMEGESETVLLLPSRGDTCLKGQDEEAFSSQFIHENNEFRDTDPKAGEAEAGQEWIGMETYPREENPALKEDKYYYPTPFPISPPEIGSATTCEPNPHRPVPPIPAPGSSVAHSTWKPYYEPVAAIWPSNHEPKYFNKFSTQEQCDRGAYKNCINNDHQELTSLQVPAVTNFTDKSSALLMNSVTSSTTKQMKPFTWKPSRPEVSKSPSGESRTCHNQSKEKKYEDLVLSAESLNYECGLCHLRTRTLRGLKMHMLYHKVQGPAVCVICGEVTGDVFTLGIHVGTHPGGHDRLLRERLLPKRNEKRLFVCHICDKTYYKIRLFKEHIRKHTGEMPFQCNFCGKKFRVTNYYNIHLKKHHT